MPHASPRRQQQPSTTPPSAGGRSHAIPLSAGALGLLILVTGAQSTLAVGDSKAQEFQEDSLLSQLRRRIDRAPQGRLLWIRPDPSYVSGPYCRSPHSLWVGRRNSASRTQTDLVELDASGRELRIRTLRGPLGPAPVMTTVGWQVALEQGRTLIARSANGTQRWRSSSSFRGAQHLAPTRAGGVVVADSHGKLHQVDWQGRRRWSTPLGGRSTGAPLVRDSGEVVVCLQGTGRLVAISPTGRPTWRDDAARCTGAPQETPSGMLTSPGDGGLRRYKSGGILQWSTPVAGRLGPPYVAPDGSTYVATNRGLLAKVSPAGQILWTFPLGKPGTAPRVLPSPAGGLLLTSAAGYVLSISTDGHLRWWFKIPGTTTRLWPRLDGAVLVLAPGNALRMIAPPNLRRAPRASKP